MNLPFLLVDRERTGTGRRRPGRPPVLAAELPDLLAGTLFRGLPS